MTAIIGPSGAGKSTLMNLMTRTEPDGESNPEETKPEDYCKSFLLENGSMESIDEHCKNFATSSWTQFKVGMSSSDTLNYDTLYFRFFSSEHSFV